MSRLYSIQRNPRPVFFFYFVTILSLLPLAAGQQGSPTARTQTAQQPVKRDDYVGSEECATCHPDIYEKYSHTDMGRSMLTATPSALKDIPISAPVFDQRLNRHFELYARDGNFYQSEFELSPDGKEVFRDTRKIDWIIGAGANGSGAIVRQGDYLFEAPLSFYSNIHGWALSPGYEYTDYAFSRPILPGCIVCHSGRPQPELDGNGRFGQPPFRELAIGCENCHGPGGPHAAAASPETIVNPAKLSKWQADSICLPCHQTGDARVLQPGKDYGDLRPGVALDETLAIFMVPFTPQSPPQDDLLEHYLSMRLSKCYRQSEGKLSCITCHDPHTQPSRAEVPAYFRERCLTCHTEKSCPLSLAERQKQNPPDNCVGCHMPKREVKVISHSVLTNHRIVRTPQEPFPEEAFHMTTPELPDLVRLSAEPGKHVAPPPLTMLRAYRKVMLSHPEYRERYWKLGKELAATRPDDITVLEALADFSLQENNAEGLAAAIRYLDRARALGTTDPADFEQLAKALIAAHQETNAVEVLKQGVDLIPYDPVLHQLLAKTYISLKDQAKACEVAGKASPLFPQDDSLRSFVKQCAAPGK
jgi:hypothetical protein